MIGMNERPRMNGRRMINRLRLSGVIGLGAAIECSVAGRIVEVSNNGHQDERIAADDQGI